MSKATRYTLADRKTALIQDIKKLGLDKEDIILNLLEIHLSSRGNTAAAVKDNIILDGVTYYPCSRTGKFFKAEDMVLTDKGISKGYSKISQDYLTATRSSITKAKKAITTHILSGNIERATEIAKDIKGSELSIEDKSLYKSITYHETIEQDGETIVKEIGNG